MSLCGCGCQTAMSLEEVDMAYRYTTSDYIISKLKQLYTKTTN